MASLASAHYRLTPLSSLPPTPHPFPPQHQFLSCPLSNRIRHLHPTILTHHARARSGVIIAHALEVVGDTQESAKLVKEDVLIPNEDDSVAGGGKVEYNWEKEWYPLYLVNQIPRDAPLGLSVFDKPLVVFYDGNGALNCLEDRCPHRAAKLSEGQLMEGRLECLYHGWQFNGEGSCAKIPQSGFHVVQEQKHIFPACAMKPSHCRVDPVISREGVRALGDVVIDDPMRHDILRYLIVVLILLSPVKGFEH